MDDEKKDPHYIGHRERLKKKFQNFGSQPLEDYELLELLLFFVIPRKDTKVIAKNLLARFENLPALFNADFLSLKMVSGVGDNGALLIKIINALVQRKLQTKIKEKPIFLCDQQVVDYCHLNMGYQIREHLRLLFLNNKNQLIMDDLHQIGTVDYVTFYVREIIKRALDLGASSLIIIHNHPSGDPTPSTADIQVTENILLACQHLGIILHDHLIISKNRFVSLKQLGYIKHVK